MNFLQKFFVLFISLVLIVALSLAACSGCNDDDDDDDDDNVVDDDDLIDDDEFEDDDDFDDDDDDTTGDLWVDTETNLVWQNSTDCCYDWNAAIAFCENLVLGGIEDWRLPSVSELRSLISGCVGTESSSTCNVTDTCLSSTCWNDPCEGCASGEGPAEGCYWLSQLNGECTGVSVAYDYFWTNAMVDEWDDTAWYVNFHSGAVNHHVFTSQTQVRCVSDL